MEEEQDRQNDEVMEMSAEHIKQVCDSVRKVLGTSKKKALDPAQAPKLQIGTSTIKSPFGERK